MLKAGKIGQRKDLSDFDNGQIAMAKGLDESILKNMWVPGMQWLGHMKSGPRKY